MTKTRLFLTFVLAPTVAVAQAAFTTEWPSGAEPLLPDTLRQRLVGKTWVARPATGPEVRTQYQESRAYINVGENSDSGTWRTEGSTVCNEWKKFRPGCSEIRALGDALYVKRANNGEIMALVPK
jgi:hypothetical protein